MEIGLVAVVAVVVLVSISILGAKIGVAAPLLLVVLGIGVGYIPWIPLVEVDPEIILLGVLPPLLYSAAVNVPLIDFRRNFRPVVGLSVALVIISALVIGLVVHVVVPEIPFPVAVALGAVVSPPDAVAATSVGKRLGMPERVVSILEGESLVNDATSLVLLKTALAAVAGGFAFWNAAGSFAFSVTVALTIGYLIGILTVRIRSYLSNPVYDTAISFAVPFVAFIPAEALHASGVLAVVVTGLYTGHHSAKRFSATARMNKRLNWRTIQFFLENGVFLLMGVQLHSLIDQIGPASVQLHHIVMLSLLLVTILITCRTLFIAPLIVSMRRTAQRFIQRRNSASKFVERVRRTPSTHTGVLKRIEFLELRSQADLAHEQEQSLGWRDGVVLSWSGMRGVVTLAAAQSIPMSTPYRAPLVLLAFLIAVITLLMHGLTLPPLIKKLWPEGARGGTNPGELTSLKKDLLEAADEAINSKLETDFEDPAHPHLTPELAEQVRHASRDALTGMVRRATPVQPESPAQCYLTLSLLSLEAQRTALLEERAIGRYSSSALRAAELALDAYESRLTSH